jgi:hypothetical protein
MVAAISGRDPGHESRDAEGATAPETLRQNGPLSSKRCQEKWIPVFRFGNATGKNRAVPGLRKQNVHQPELWKAEAAAFPTDGRNWSIKAPGNLSG